MAGEVKKVAVEVTQSPGDLSAMLGQVSADVTAIKADVDRIMQPLVEALTRNKYFDEFHDRLRKAERVTQAWRDWPLVVGIHEAVVTLRKNEVSDKLLLEHLEGLLFQTGITEYGFEGEKVNPDEVDIVGSQGVGEFFYVKVCRRPGLRDGALPLRKPIVEIARLEESAS